MKRIIYSICITLSLLGTFGCTLEIDYKAVDVTPVPGFVTPQTGYYLELQATAGMTFGFSWLPSTAEDGYGVQYEIVFLNGPTGEEVYRLDAGMSTSLKVAHKEINRIAAAAGIEPGAVGPIYWTVDASRGEITHSAEETARQINVKRLLGFTYVPTSLYLVGSASENGNNGVRFVPKNLIKWKAGSLNSLAGDEGEFEIFTQLKAGTYTFTEGFTDDAHSWGVEGGVLSETPTAVEVTAPGLYHITIDFNVRGYIIKKITSLRYNKGGGETEMTYAGNAHWTVTLPVESGDDRYNFRLYEDGNSYPWSALGNAVWDQSSSTSWTDTSGPNFSLYLTPYTDIPSGQLDWQPTFKWLKANMAFSRELTVDLSGFDANGNVVQYNHYYTVLE